MRWCAVAAACLALGGLASVAAGSFRGRNGRIAFVAERVNGAPGIISIDENGHDRRNLTRHADSSPVVSPNGRLVAFTRDFDSDHAAVYVMNADGADQRELAPGALPSWSPDGKRLAYDAPDTATRGGGVSVLDLASGRSTALGRPGLTGPIWSPDGTHIAGVETPAPSYEPRLVVMRSDGSDQRVLAPSANFFAWSPDGKRIAFASGIAPQKLQVVALDGTLDTILVRDFVSYVLWSPDGRSIAFRDGPRVDVVSLADQSVRMIAGFGYLPLAWSPDSNSLALLHEQAPGDQIVIAAADGPPLRQITHEDPTSHITNSLPGVRLSWSSAGKLFVQHTPGTDDEILSVRPDGKGLQQLTHNSTDDEQPAWSPDGRQVAFVRDVDPSERQNFELYVMSADGRHARRLTMHLGFDEFPAWSPNGRWIAVFRQISDNDSGIAAMSPTGGHLRILAHRLSALYLSWSPDGTRIAFATPSADGTTTDVAVVGANGRGLRRIAEGTAPDWSPSGKQIVFERFTDCGPNCDTTRLLTMRADGSHQHTIPASSDLASPHYSPDGTRIVASGYNGLVLLDPARGPIATLAAGGSSPGWQPRP